MKPAEYLYPAGFLSVRILKSFISASQSIYYNICMKLDFKSFVSELLPYITL